MANNLNVWPPAYQIQTSMRAKQIRLQITARKGLQIIIPKNTDHKIALDFLNQRRKWVQKHLSTIDIGNNQNDLPTCIDLPAINNNWQIRYEKIIGLNKKIMSTKQQLIVLEDPNEKIKCQKILLTWIREQAEQHLIPWLQQVSLKCELPFNNVVIRSQQTRWGSCSYKKTISLNDKLLFFPKHWVEYVLIHELAHTKHLNHSPKFWHLVTKFVPDYLQIRQGFKQANKILPRWVTKC